MATHIDGTARLWRNDKDGEPQLTVIVAGHKVWLRIRKSSADAYAQATALLDAAETAQRQEEDWNPGQYTPEEYAASEARFDWPSAADI